MSAGADDFYEGSFSLDQALADRFAFIIYVPDWNELTKEEQELVIHPSGEGAITKISLELTRLISKLKSKISESHKESFGRDLIVLPDNKFASGRSRLPYFSEKGETAGPELHIDFYNSP
ncbi:MAG: hypothetical protein IPG78_04205 [Ignavibacteria bacterium]|nr:hypothetical protein [Ignavibacteria bacterium]